MPFNPPPTKRLNYFDHQFLRVEDFTTEQAYHLGMRRAHNQLFHTWGVARGLELVPSAERSVVTVTHGAALDALGQEIVLGSDTETQDLSGFAGKTLYVTLRYEERETDRTDETGAAGNRRREEMAVLEVSPTPPDDPTTRLVLGWVEVDGAGKVAGVSGGTGSTARRQAGAVSPELEPLTERVAAVEDRAGDLESGVTELQEATAGLQTGVAEAVEGMKSEVDGVRNMVRTLRLEPVEPTGQACVPGSSLSLRVRVVDGTGRPEADTPAVVRYQVASGAGKVAGIRTSVDVPVGTDGTAACTWRPDSANFRQEVTATLLYTGETDLPIAEPQEVRFTANLSAAQHTVYTPPASVPLLAGKGTVQAAVDALGGRVEQLGLPGAAGMRVTDVQLNGLGRLHNDTAVVVDELVSRGIGVILSEAPDPRSLRGRDSCILTVELPTLAYDSATQQSVPVNYQQVLLPVEVRNTAGSNRVEIRLGRATGEWLLRTLSYYFQSGAVRANVVLKGNFIWSQADPNRYLEGGTLGEVSPDGRSTHLRLDATDPRRPGDFETWFHLVPKPIYVFGYRPGVGYGYYYYSAPIGGSLL